MSSENDSNSCVEEASEDANFETSNVIDENNGQCTENVYSNCTNKAEDKMNENDGSVSDSTETIKPSSSVENTVSDDCFDSKNIDSICMNSRDKPNKNIAPAHEFHIAQEVEKNEITVLKNNFDVSTLNLPDCSENEISSSTSATVPKHVNVSPDKGKEPNSEPLSSRNSENANNTIESQTEEMHQVFHQKHENISRVPNGIPEDLISKLFPIHEKLQSELISLQQVCKQQADQISRLQNENHKMTLELAEKSSVSSSEIYEVQMEALEKTIMQLQREAEMYKNKLLNHDEVAKRTISQLQQDLGSKLEKMTKMYEAANKDKEMMVIKYAQSQKEVLNLKKILEDLDKKLKDGIKEKETFLLKIKNLNSERSRLSQCLEAKNSELNTFQRENEKLKDQLTSKDIKIKWAQNKLRTEMDAHKETEVKLERTQQKLQEMREEAEQIRRDCQAMIRTYQDSEEIKSNSLDLQLKEKESELKMHKQEKNDQDEVYHLVKKELEALKKKHKITTDENNALTVKVQALERERLEYETNCSRLKETVNNYKQEIVDLSGKLSEMENLQTLLERQKEKCAISQQEIERFRQANLELQNDMDSCREREGELLEFTERLTSKNVVLQSEFAAIEAKNQMLVLDMNRTSKMNEALEEENANLQSKFKEETVLRQQETQLLARKLAEKTRTVENLMLKLDEEMNENKVMKRRHVASVKELTREVQLLKRRLETVEQPTSEKLNANSRTSSSGSLDSYGKNNALTGINNPALSQLSNAKSITSVDQEPNVLTVQPTQQIIIERLVKLQRTLARRNEKIEFLEEHINQLDIELRKKSRIIQGYVMKLETGALATTKMDENKMEVARKGGIMASVYSSHASDGSMTLELSLEINRKLQAVLEDTLLKNITLKENINTLGCEIARLTQEHQSLEAKLMQTAETV